MLHKPQSHGLTLLTFSLSVLPSVSDSAPEEEGLWPSATLVIHGNRMISCQWLPPPSMLCWGIYESWDRGESHNIEVAKSAVSLKISLGSGDVAEQCSTTPHKFPQISREQKARFSETIVKGKENNSERKGRLRMWLMVCGCVSGSC